MCKASARYIRCVGISVKLHFVHQYATLEHLLLAPIDEVDVSAVMKACKVDLGALKEHLVSYIDNDLKALVIDDGESRPTADFQRVIQRAVIPSVLAVLRLIISSILVACCTGRPPGFSPLRIRPI